MSIIQIWSKDDNDFIETRASRYLESLNKSEHTFIMVLGDGGSGKSFLIQHEALRMQKQGFEIVPIYDPADISKYYNIDRNQIFVNNDCFGSVFLHELSVQKWSLHVQQIKHLLLINHTNTQ